MNDSASSAASKPLVKPSFVTSGGESGGMSLQTGMATDERGGVIELPSARIERMT